MAHLHELLAVESNLRGQAQSCLKDLENTFEKKRAHFSEIIVTFKPLAEGQSERVESKMGVQTTVKRELKWVGDKLAKAMDTAYQIDIANTQAKADVTLEDGAVLLKDVPTTALLQLGHRLEEIKKLVDSIPTLDPTKGFEPDAQKGDDYFRARDVVKDRTEKDWKVLTLAPATEKHAAQVEKIAIDKPIGQIVQQEWSSLITVAEKGDMLDRVEAVIRAVKRARSRANDENVDVRENKIGSKLLDYVFSAKI